MAHSGYEGTSYVPLEKYSEQACHDVIEINLKRLFLCMKYELPHLVASKGAMVNMASVAGLTGGRLGAGLLRQQARRRRDHQVTKAAAVEYAYADKGVRINAVAPGEISTEMAERAFFRDPAVTACIKSMHPMGRLGEPSEVEGGTLAKLE